MRYVNRSFPQPGDPGVLEGVVIAVDDGEGSSALIVTMKVDGPPDHCGTILMIPAARFNKKPNVGNDVVYATQNDFGVVCRRVADEQEAIWEFQEFNMRMFDGTTT